MLRNQLEAIWATQRASTGLPDRCSSGVAHAVKRMCHPQPRGASRSLRRRHGAHCATQAASGQMTWHWQKALRKCRNGIVRFSRVPRRLIRRAALVACAGPFVKSRRNSGDFAKGVDRNWSSGPAVNLIVCSPGVGLPVLCTLNLTLDHSCTHGTYGTTLAGAFPCRLCSCDAAMSYSGCGALRKFRTANLLSDGTC